MSGPGAPGPDDPARRELLGRLAAGAAFAPLLVAAASATAAPVDAAKLPLLSQSDPAARANHYVSDAHRAQGAQAGTSCSNCALYGSVTPSRGTCSLFPNNLVQAAGWCSAWSGL